MARDERLLLVEEADALALRPSVSAPVLEGEAARALLEHAGDRKSRARRAGARARRERADRARAVARRSRSPHFARDRAARTCRRTTREFAPPAPASPRVSVEAVLPADVIGLFVLLPAGV